MWATGQAITFFYASMDQVICTQVSAIWLCGTALCVRRLAGRRGRRGLGDRTRTAHGDARRPSPDAAPLEEQRESVRVPPRALTAPL